MSVAVKYLWSGRKNPVHEDTKLNPKCFSNIEFQIENEISQIEPMQFIKYLFSISLNFLIYSIK